MVSSSPSAGDARSAAAGAPSAALQPLPGHPEKLRASDSSTRDEAAVASPAAEITHGASDNGDTTRLRIQAPGPSGRASGSSSAGAVAGPASVSPASELSSPADDGVDTPDGGVESGVKRRRLVEDGGNLAGGVSPASTSPPLFLEKTYEMLDRSLPDVACWSPSGDSFIVKNPVEFAEHVIPIYFKHKNFSSFVRQLNFYGFRKVRVVDPEITGGVDPKDWWEFRHEKFLRGRKGLLKEIKRRSLPSHSNAAVSPGGPDSASRTLVDRAELDELRSEVVSLREQIQTLNKHMFSVMQIMMMRNGPSTPGPGSGPGPVPVPVPVSGFASPHVHHPHLVAPQYSFISGLPPPHPPQSVHNGLGSTKSEKRGPTVSAPSGSTPTSSVPASGGFGLRPLPSISGSNMSSGYIPALVSAADHVMDWDSYARHAFQSGHVLHTPRSSGPHPSQAEAAASQSVPAAVGLKRSRTHPAPTSTPRSPPSTVTFLDNPEAAVRQMSMLVTHIRDELLQSIIARTLGFVRAQPPVTSSSSNKKAEATPEVEMVAEAMAGEIQHKLDQINGAEAATQGKPVGSYPPSETSHMYRVEILKFVSKELPRAMQDAVEKRLPPPTKKALNRSLLALMVQKAQAALERQMRVETAANTSPSGSNGSSNGGSK